MRGGEMHHRRRYANQIALSAHFYGDDITEAEQSTARRLVSANADNFGATVKRVCFYKTIAELEAVTL